MIATDATPFALYQVPTAKKLLCLFIFVNYIVIQSLEIDSNLLDDRTEAKTTIWTAFKQVVIAGTRINLHCRQCTISAVMFYVIITFVALA